MARTKTMLSCEVCGSDKFLDLTFEAQALYFHILMNADGMGAFDAARSLLRQVGSGQGALDELVRAGFVVHAASETDEAYFVVHWWAHNKLDRRHFYKGQHWGLAVEKLRFASESERFYLLTDDVVDTSTTCSLEVVLNITQQNITQHNENMPEGAGRPGNAICPTCGNGCATVLENGRRHGYCNRCRNDFYC